MKEAIIIANPASGGGEGEQLSEKLGRELEQYFDQVIIKLTKTGDDAVNFAKEAAQAGVSAVFVIGGDGTIKEAVSGVAGEEKRPVMGFLPAGTNNTYLQLFGLPTDSEAAMTVLLEMVAKERIHTVDIGQCEGEYFAYYVSFGALVEATTSTSREEKDRLGSLAYAKNIIGGLWKDRTFELEIESDTENFKGQASNVFVMIADRIGTRSFSTEGSTLQDGLLNVFILTNDSLKSKVDAVFDLLHGRVDENEEVTHFTCHELSIKAPSYKESLDLDGNKCLHLPVHIKMLPQHLAFYVPYSEALG